MAKNAPGNAGDCWTLTAIDAETKLIPSWYVGSRDSDAASFSWMTYQLSSEGHKAYLEAVEGAFGGDIDYVQLVKIYGASPESAKGRYSPAECTGIRKTRIEGNPISTRQLHMSSAAISAFGCTRAASHD